MRRRPDSNWGIELLQSSALPLGYVALASGWRESNPRVDLGKVTGYHYITPAGAAFGSPRNAVRPAPIRLLSPRRISASRRKIAGVL